ILSLISGFPGTPGMMRAYVVVLAFVAAQCLVVSTAQYFARYGYLWVTPRRTALRLESPLERRDEISHWTRGGWRRPGAGARGRDRVPGRPAAGALEGAGRAGEATGVPRVELLGSAGGGFRGSERTDGDRRPGAGSAWGESNRAHLHRGRL